MSLALIVKPKQGGALIDTIIIVSHPKYGAQEYNHHYRETLNNVPKYLAFVNSVTIKFAYVSPKFSDNSYSQPL